MPGAATSGRGGLWNLGGQAGVRGERPCAATPEKDMTRPTMTRLTLILALLTLTACETMEGFGRDVEQAGEEITQESVETQSGM